MFDTDYQSFNYKMKKIYNADNLIIANLEYISNKKTPYGPMVVKTDQKYIFEKIKKKGKIRYREIFTGFIADSNKPQYFNLPYIVNIVSLKEYLSLNIDKVTKYSLLLTLDEINSKKLVKKKK